MRKEHFLNHCRLFAPGNFVALHENRVIGLGSGFLIDFDFDQAQHSFLEIIDGGYYSQARSLKATGTTALISACILIIAGAASAQCSTRRAKKSSSA